MGWKDASRQVTASDSEHAKIIATVEVPSDYDPKKQALLEKALEKLRVQFGFFSLGGG